MKQPSKKTGTGTHSKQDRGADFYETPEVATLALLENLDVPFHVWEPAAGRGAMSRVLEKNGRTVLKTDLHAHDGADAGIHGGVDFLKVARLTDHSISAVVTNPPFMYAADFVRKTLDLGIQGFFLLPLNFLSADNRSDIMDDGGPLAGVYPFKNRLPMMHRDGWTGKKAGSAMNFAWYHFRKGHNGVTHLKRIAWRKF
jgi:hypothetical protein